MGTVMEFLKDYSYVMYLGSVLAVYNIAWNNWRFYTIIVPVVTLVIWKAS